MFLLTMSEFSATPFLCVHAPYRLTLIRPPQISNKKAGGGKIKKKLFKPDLKRCPNEF